MKNINHFLSDLRFERYFDLITEYNQKFNLTTILQKDQVYLKHFADSLLPIEIFSKNAKILDIGSGSGMPGIPLAIARDDLKITMVDSVFKKVGFLNIVIGELKLENAAAIHSRIEDLKVSNFDYVVAKAVAPLNILIEYALPFLKIGGFLVAYKAENVDEEIGGSKRALDVMGGVVESVEVMELDGETRRKFVLIKKERVSPRGYPRRGNKPRIEPL